MKHTHGPWTVESDKTTGSMGYQVVITGPAPDGAPRQEMIANAALIAAAPDLLAALENLLDAVNYNHPTVGDCNQALAAIKKAKVEA